MFFKKGRGALWVCIWNQGGGGPKTFGNRWSRCINVTLNHFCIKSYNRYYWNSIKKKRAGTLFSGLIARYILTPHKMPGLCEVALNLTGRSREFNACCLFHFVWLIA
jgi:hypothetical protein